MLRLLPVFLPVLLLAASVPGLGTVPAHAGPKAEARATQAAVERVVGTWGPQLPPDQQKQVDVLRLAVAQPPGTDEQLAALGLDEQALAEARRIRDAIAADAAERQQATMALQMLDGLSITITPTTMTLAGLGQEESVNWSVRELEGDDLHITVTRADGSEEPSTMRVLDDGTLKVFEGGQEKLHLRRR